MQATQLHDKYFLDGQISFCTTAFDIVFGPFFFFSFFSKTVYTAEFNATALVSSMLSWREHLEFTGEYFLWVMIKQNATKAVGVHLENQDP